MMVGIIDRDLLWDEADFRLSVVSRWQVMPTIRKQSVAEHQHNVAKIAERLAVNVYGWHKFDPEIITLIRFALSHDDDEAIFGDQPSYVKPFIQQVAMREHLGDFVRPAMYDEPIDDVTEFIVKAADYIDAGIFLRVEISMGNKTVAGVLADLESRFERKCQAFNTEDCLGMLAWDAYIATVSEMFHDGQLTVEKFRF